MEMPKIKEVRARVISEDDRMKELSMLSMGAEYASDAKKCNTFLSANDSVPCCYKG